MSTTNSPATLLTMPADWWAAFRRAARAEKLTLSEWIGEAAKAKLPAAERKKLSERPARGRRPKAKA